MAPRATSRYLFCSGITDSAGRIYLTDRVRYGYREMFDNRFHVVSQGDTLFSLAAMYFSQLSRPAGYWWVIADFQPEPIHDPTITLTPGRVLVIPSVRTIQEEIFNESRRREFSA